MDEIIDEFYELMHRHIDSKIRHQIVWATVKEVDWDKKTMTATGLLDDLDYQDVLLGLGSYYRYPTVGSKCLIGVIENKPASVFLLDCESFQEDQTISGDTVMQVKESGFVFKKGDLSLRSQLIDLIDETNNINKELQKVVVAVGVTPNVPSLIQIHTKLESVKDKIKQIIIE